MSDPLRVVVAEDQALLREGIVRLLGDAGFEVVAEAGDAPDLLRKVGAHKPDVAVVDVQMPPDNEDDGLRAAIEIRAAQPEVGVLVLSQFAEERYALDLVGDDAERRRLPAQGPCVGLRRVRRRGPARRRRRRRARSDGGLAHARPPPPRRSAGGAHADASARCSS